MSEQQSTPREDGFSMPAEWEPHEACLKEWPTLTRGELWGARFEEAKHDYAAVATAIEAFEPVVMMSHPEDPGGPDHERGRDNLDRLRHARDAKGGSST